MNLGIIGYGGVSKALVRLLEEKEDYLKINNIDINIKYIVKSDGGVVCNNNEFLYVDNLKESNLWVEGLNYMDILNDEEVDMVIELTNTNIETGEPAKTHIREAFKRKKHVVTGNKGPILNGYKELKRLSVENGLGFGIGCTVGGALPSYIVGKSGLSGSEILSIRGILNGTSNYILEEMFNNDISFSEALEKAQKLGIAEKNPILDVGGYDTASKMSIIVNSLCDKEFSIKDISLVGIEGVSRAEILEAKSNGRKIKIVGQWNRESEEKIVVGPMEVSSDDLLFGVNDRNKGIVFESDTLGEIFIAGGESSVRGAAASIFRDILNIIMDLK